MSDGTTLMLAALSTVLVLYVVQHERKSGATTSLGKTKKPRASLGQPDCANVAIDSPDFERCATTLGSGRSVLRSKPRADNITADFTNDNYKPGNLGNPFSVRQEPQMTLGRGEAFPFSESGALPNTPPPNVKPKSASSLGYKKQEVRGQKFERVHGLRGQNATQTTVEAPARGSGRSTVTLGSTVEQGMKLNSAYLGAAVSPSSTKLGATAQEIAQSTNKLDDTNEVSSNTGGNLNLLHPL